MNTSEAEVGRPYHLFFALSSITGSSGGIRVFLLVTLPIIFALGLFGNVSTFLVMSSKQFRRLSYANYLVLLSVTDLARCLSLTGIPVFEAILESGFNTGITFSSRVRCIAYEFTFELSVCYSSWLVVAITLERLLVVLFPFTSRLICTPFFARVVMAVMFIPNTILSSYTLMIMQYSPNLGCYFTFENQRMAFVFTVSYIHFVPVILILSFNSIIAIALYRSRNFGTTKATDGKTKTKNLRTTTMLVTVSLVFAATNMPNTVTSFMVIPAYLTERLLTAFTVVISVNYAINFYIYLLLGNEVRVYFFKKIRCK
ncbi:uncharacterized protein LOC141905413 [Tubulanus polymorphus]|uniref:uncharacterized protein LOC141905413 n=1 Tax=Tubulanus polymorphus TaxID=672921 RepID=UPI003DA2D833